MLPYWIWTLSAGQDPAWSGLQVMVVKIKSSKLTFNSKVFLPKFFKKLHTFKCSTFMLPCRADFMLPIHGNIFKSRFRVVGGYLIYRSHVKYGMSFYFNFLFSCQSCGHIQLWLENRKLKAKFYMTPIYIKHRLTQPNLL